MRKVATDARLIAKCAVGSPKRIRGLVVESKMIVHEIADSLHPRPAGRGVAKIGPGEVAKPIGVAIAAAKEKPEHLIGQFLDVVLDGFRHDDIGLSGIVDVETCRNRCQPRRRLYSCARVAKSIDVTAGFDRSIKAYDLVCQQIDAP